MPEKVWKYPISARGDTVLHLPNSSVLMHAGHDLQGQLCVWARVDPEFPRKRKVVISTVWTGETFPENAAFLGTVLHNGLILHVFVRAPRIYTEDNDAT